MISASFQYCEKYGYDENKIKRRLSFLYLSENNRLLARQLHDEVIAPHLDSIIEQFYEVLMFHPESRRILTTGELIQRLKSSQRDYLLTLGLNFDTQPYFEERLRIGLTHAWVGVPLSVYQIAYSNLTQIIINAIPAKIEGSQRKQLVDFLLKITALDITLATETYHASLLNALEEEVSRMHTREGELRQKASTDSLTGLLNHENSFNYLQQAIHKAQEKGQPLSVMMADLDLFKRVNDTYGHMVGDAVLQETASRILASVREPDVVGRYGGEEFLVILADAGMATAQRIAERIRQRIASTPINVQGELIEITISLGVTTLGQDDDLETLIKRADAALYTAKHSGRDCIVSQ